MAEEVSIKISTDASQAVQSVGSLKKQLREAQQEVVILSDKFGDSSTQALDAAKRAAELKDKIGDAKALVDTFNPDKKFVALGGAIQGATGAFSALQGAMGLLGQESSQVESALLKVQSALALQQGVSGIAASIDSVKLLGKSIINNLGKGGAIGLGIAGVTALGLALANVFTNKQKEAAKAYNETLEDYKKAAADAIQETNKVKLAFEQAKSGVISKKEALQIYNDTLGDSLGKTNDLSVAEKNLADKADAYVKITALKAQANALFAKSAEKTAEALIAQQEVDKYGLKESGGFLGDIYKTANVKIAEAEKTAKSIGDLGSGLLNQAAELSKKYNITDDKAKKDVKDNTKNILNDNKQAIEQLRKLRQQAELDAIEDENKRAIRKAEIDFENRKIEIDALKASEKYKTELLVEAEKNRDKLIAEAKDAATQAEFDAIFEKLEKEQQIEDIEKKRIADANQKEFDDIFAQLEAETESERKAAEAQKQIEKEKSDFKKQQLNEVGDALTKLGDIVGKETAAGKAIGIATALINTYQGATEALKQKSTLPSPLDFAAKAINVGAIIASGIKSVKAITAVKVPGGGGGQSAPVTSLTAGGSAPISPSLPIQTTMTQLDQGTINRLGSATNRAYVVETDITNSQERIRRINRAARLN